MTKWKLRWRIMRRLFRTFRSNDPSPTASITTYQAEPKPQRRSPSFRQDLPQSLDDLSQEQLELALKVVHQQTMYSPFVGVLNPPQELSQLHQSEWMCLLEVWEQLLNQRLRHPLH